MVEISVIVPVWNDAAGLQRTLQALSRQSIGLGRFEVLVVDNGSSPPLALSRTAPNVRLLVEPDPGSYAARNRALREARGRVLAFTDAGCVPAPQWLGAGLDALAGGERRAFAGGDIVVTGARPDRLGPVEAYEALVCFSQRTAIENYGCSVTANLFVPRTVMERVGPFDRLRSGGDWAWCRRAVAAGIEPVYAPDALVAHPARGSRSAVLARERRIVGGHRDQDPGWQPCLRYCLRLLLPPRRAVGRIWQLPSSRITMTSRLLATLFAFEARYHMAGTRIWLEMTGAPSAR